MRHMSQTYGIEAPHPAGGMPHRSAVHFVVVIDAAGARSAMLFSAQRELLAQIDAGSEEAASLVRGVAACKGADQALWDHALQGHALEERASAELYTVPI